MQLLCPVTEGSQLPQTQRISRVWPCKEAAWLPLSCSCPADAPLEETGSWSTVNCQLWAGIQGLLLFGLSTESPCMENGQRVTPVKPETAQELQKGLQLKAGVFVWCPNCHEKSHIWKIQCKTNSWEININGQTVSNMVPKCNRNVQTVNLKAVLIHAMNTVSSEPALTTHQVFPTPKIQLKPTEPSVPKAHCSYLTRNPWQSFNRTQRHLDLKRFDTVNDKSKTNILSSC